MAFSPAMDCAAQRAKYEEQGNERRRDHDEYLPLRSAAV
jgi:hypothetical protein